MAAESYSHHREVYAIFYDGTNEAEVLAHGNMDEAHWLTEEDGDMFFQVADDPAWAIHTGFWAVGDEFYLINEVSDADFPATYYKLGDYVTEPEVAPAISAWYSENVKLETGSGKTGTILLGNHQDVVVDLTDDMGTSSYNVKLVPMSGLIGNAALTVQSKDATTVTVRVTAGVAVVSGSTFMVVATTP